LPAGGTYLLGEADKFACKMTHIITGAATVSQGSATSLDSAVTHLLARRFMHNTQNAPWVLLPHQNGLCSLTNEKQYVGFEVFTEVVKSSFFWDIIPCKPVKVNRRFGGT
jgi:hypothetical protein